MEKSASQGEIIKVESILEGPLHIYVETDKITFKLIFSD